MFFTLGFLFLRTFFATIACVLARSPQNLEKAKLRWSQSILNRFGFKMVVVGEPPGLQPCFLVGNHISFLDIPVLMGAVPDSVFISKADLKKWPIIGAAAKSGRTVFVERGGFLGANFKTQVLNIIKSEKLVIFPSGTTSLNEQRPWKKGIFKVAQENNIPVQLFRLDYIPLRPCAYIDNDNLLKQMLGMLKIQNKQVRLTWIEKHSRIEDPGEFAQYARQKVLSRAEIDKNRADG